MPLIALSAILVSLTLKNSPTIPNEKSRLSRVDFAGALTLSLTLVLLLLGLNSGGNIVPWTHPLVLASVSMSVVAAGAFVLVDRKYASEPIIPMHLLFHRTVLSACLMNLLITMVLFMTTYYAPIFFQVEGSPITASSVSVWVLLLAPSPAAIS